MSLTHLLLRVALGRRLPVTTGEVRLHGPGEPITIRRDQYGVPHIDAASETDAWFGLGFCQGQDRAVQLEVFWRVARGRLAEWVGPDGLPADRMSRRIGFRRAAEAQVPALSAHVRGQFAAFVAGVSAGATRGLPRKPHEFALIGGEPSPWDVADVLAVLKLQSFALPSNWDVELARLRILLADGPAALLALDPSTAAPATGGTGLAPPAVVEQLSRDLGALQTYLPRGGGSNNWLIAGNRTASGKPLLASDPHLAPGAPAPWYLSHAKCPEWEAAGASLAGTPGYAIGHNGFAAWGVTAGLTDNSDLFLETIGPDGTSVRQPDGTFHACEVAHEVIRVKDGEDVVEEVLLTPRGPVVSPLAPDVPLAISLRAVWLDPLPAVGFLGILAAKSFDEFREPFREWPLLPLNMLYANANGETGWQLIGQLPKRASGNGLLPRPGDVPDSDWVGLVPFDEMPHGRDFAAGYFATANNDPLSGGRLPPVGGVGLETQGADASRSAEPWLGADYCDDYRVRAINAALAASEKWTVEECLELQRDVRCIPWEEIRDTVLSLDPQNADSRDALELLRGWDGRVDAESPAACVFELFVAEMCARVARAKAPKAWAAALGEAGLGAIGHNLFTDRRVAHLVRLIRTRPDGWFASWESEMESVLTGVVRRLRGEVGPGPAYWGWGHLRQLRLDHPLLGKHRWLGPAFNVGPVPCGGDCNTVSQAGARPADPTAFTHNMCNMRTVFDLADLSKSRFVLCGGQSGNPWSDHHADQFPLWQEGGSIPIPWLQAEVVRAARATLRLLPE